MAGGALAVVVSFFFCWCDRRALVSALDTYHHRSTILLQLVSMYIPFVRPALYWPRSVVQAVNEMLPFIGNGNN